MIQTILLLGIFSFVSCGSFQKIFQSKKVCLVLSVGGGKGIAHIGAIDALKKKKQKIDCVFGNSIGSVIGAIYSLNPELNLKDQYGQVIGKFLSKSKKSSEANYSVENFFSDIGKALNSDKQTDWISILGKISSTILNQSLITDFDHEQFKNSLDEVFQKKDISETKIPFATSYHAKSGDGLELVIVKSGNLAEAVARSANNPFLFKSEIQNLQFIDPGSDRLASVPVVEACKHFQPATLIVVNVTGKPALTTPDTNCVVREIMANIHYDPKDAIRGVGEEFEKVYSIGYLSVMDQLD